MQKEELERLDRERVWHSFTQMSEYRPFIVESAEGSWLTDIHGQKFFDGVSNLWCNVHGHNHPKLNRAIEAQLKKVAHVTSLGMSNPVTIELAEKLVQLTPEGLNHVFFSSDGASAVEVALKMAFQFWHQVEPAQTKRTRFAALGHAYHGDTLGSVSVGGIEHFHRKFDPLLFDAIRLPSPNVYRASAEIGDANPTEWFARKYREILTAHQDEIAAVIIEPLVQGAAGMIVHPAGLLAELRNITEELDILLIADEVAMGFGRTGKLFACENESVSPDILCLGKGLSGGYLPMSATIANTKVWNAFLGSHGEAKTLFHGHTYGGNPLCAAVSLASLQLFEDENTLERLQPLIAHFQNSLERLQSHPNVGDIRTLGLLAGVEIVKERETGEPFCWTEHRGRNVCQHALDKNVWMRPLGDVVVVMPPYCSTESEIDLLVDSIAYGLDREFGP